MTRIISLLMLLVSTWTTLGCFRESVRYLKFTTEELSQAKVMTDGDYKLFSVPNKDWKIRLYLPQYRLTRVKHAIFLASRHYDGQEMITIESSIISPNTGVIDLQSCFEYRKRLIHRIEDCTIDQAQDKFVIRRETEHSISTSILNFYDNVCVDTFIITTDSKITERARTSTKQIADSLQITP